jgi:glutamyl-tRNA reductase
MRAAPAPISTADDVPALVGAVTAAAGHLTEAVARENAALRARTREALTTLAEEKSAAAGHYQKCLSQLETATEGYRALTPSQREALQQCGRLLAQEAEENTRLLKVAVEISRRFMQTVADAVRALTPNAPGYSSTGALGNDQRTSARTPALSLDRSL